MILYQEISLDAGLYIVATPIGNLRDMSLRALDTLASVDYIFCEDTRITGKLLSHFGIKTKLRVYNDHSNEQGRAGILKLLKDGQSVALVSDAGLPLISDPGYKLVSDVSKAGFYVTTIPGANAALSALQLSGLPSDQFVFLGFVPSKQKARLAVLGEIFSQKNPMPYIFYETGARIEDTLTALLSIDESCNVVIARELTKKFEEVIKGSPAKLLDHIKNNALKGEIVLIISFEKTQLSDESLKNNLLELLENLHVKEAASKLAQETGVSKKKLYDMALSLKADLKNDDTK